MLGRLFGTEKAVSKVIDTVANGLDKLVHTDEERAQEAAQDRSEARKMFIEWIRNSQGSSIARRLIALIVTGIWAIQYIISMVLSVAAPWTSDPAGIFNASKMISENGDQITGAMMLVLGFYFAAPYVGDMVKGAMGRFSGKP